MKYEDTVFSSLGFPIAIIFVLIYIKFIDYLTIPLWIGFIGLLIVVTPFVILETLKEILSKEASNS